MSEVMDHTPGEVFLMAFHRKRRALEIANRTAYVTAALGGYRDIKQSYDQLFPPPASPNRPRSSGKALKQMFANFTYLNTQSNYDKQYIGHAGELRVLSQRSSTS